MRPAALFLFAHQDDEFGVFHAIEDSLRRGLRVRCAYLTHGAHGSAARRNAESLRVLARLGVDRGDVQFAGDQLGIGDASLPRHLDAAGAWLARWIAASGAVERIYVTAWEGGHHDHDALHLLALRTAAGLGLEARVRQYSLYHGHRRPGPCFRVLAPLAANGPVEQGTIPWRARWRYLGLCLSYPSQRTTWIGLFPFVLLHYLWHGRQELQRATLARLEQRPHPGALYYERRRFYRWEQFEDDMRRWLARQPGAPPR
jgi:LmbE family N-acetylglucosaminyl deacetylase